MKRKAVVGRLPLKGSTPLRLDIAAKVYFIDGSMSAAGLRREGHRGRLHMELVAGKHFTSPQALWDLMQGRPPAEDIFNVPAEHAISAERLAALDRRLTEIMGEKDDAPEPEPKPDQTETAALPRRSVATAAPFDDPLPDRLLKLRDVREMVGLGSTTIYRMMDEGRFPRALRLGPGTVRWRWTTLKKWLDDLPVATDAEG